MGRTPIRRAQLVSPFGVGAMVTSTDGTAMVAGGLDHWFKRDDNTYTDVDLADYRVEEWRLQRALGVNHFRLPPDHRTWRMAGGQQPKNIGLKIPFLRFPRWNFCPICRSLVELGFTVSGRQRCPVCERGARRTTSTGRVMRAPFLAQVPFVAICESGHLQDFPWREWVHQDVNASCQHQMKLVATGGASLAAQRVECACGVKPRNLSQITEATTNDEGEKDTFLTKNLDRAHRYTCRGLRPWVGDASGVGCGLPIRGSLRAATNVYYAHVESAIYLPGGTAGVPEKLLEVLTNLPLSQSVHLIRRFGEEPTAAMLRDDQYAYLLEPFNDDQVNDALYALRETISESDAGEDAEHVDTEAIRRPEFEMLRTSLVAPELKIRAASVALYEGGLGRYFERINLVDQLRETRALYGFSRVVPEVQKTLSERRAMLWLDEPAYKSSWLPAYIVNGEGLYFELSEDALVEWEKRPSVVARLAVVQRQYNIAKAERGLADRSIIPRFVLLHTLAHLLINQLVFDCGYSSASLKERLYCSVGDTPMAGMLIYTAAGDSEGTMGGLVRMGRAGYLEPALGEALDRARWCSSDPVCMELGEHGQGPDSCNLAACHSCALLPETACEVFNRFLDRGLVVGTHDDPTCGFFSRSSDASTL